jgi:hypothetical protein
MKYANLFFFFVISILLFSSCRESSTESFYSPASTENQFIQIYFKYGFKNELNTFNKTFKKDLVMDGVKKIDFWLTEAEQDSILKRANEINFFSLADTFKYVQKDGITLTITPDPGEQILTIKYQTETKTTIWTYPKKLNDPDLDALLSLQNYIISIITSKPEYKALPPSRGVYG